MIAKEFGLIIKTLVNDTELKQLMLIPSSEIDNYGVLVEKYICQKYVSDIFTEDGVCRLLIRKGVSTQTNSDYVKRDSVIIEVYIPSYKDIMEGFETRINKISERLIKLLNRKKFNDVTVIYNTTYEAICGTNYFKRYINRFEYKKIYIWVFFYKLNLIELK